MSDLPQGDSSCSVCAGKSVNPASQHHASASTRFIFSLKNRAYISTHLTKSALTSLSKTDNQIISLKSVASFQTIFNGRKYNKLHNFCYKINFHNSLSTYPDIERDRLCVTLTAKYLYYAWSMVVCNNCCRYFVIKTEEWTDCVTCVYWQSHTPYLVEIFSRCKFWEMSDATLFTKPYFHVYLENSQQIVTLQKHLFTQGRLQNPTTGWPAVPPDSGRRCRCLVQ